MKITILIALLLITFAPAPGCASGSRTTTAARGTIEELNVRELPMFNARTGERLDWDALLAAIAPAEVVIIGELHDDAVGHAVQRAIIADVLHHWPDSALAMEMLERDEQALVDDYLDGIIDQETFERETFSTNWGGPGSWSSWYQPIIDDAKHAGARVIAANAPRRYVRLARTDGYERLDALPPDRRALFDRPEQLLDGPYWERFVETMSGGGAHDVNRDRLRTAFRSQMVWDATMAASIAAANPTRRAKVVHLIGQFHSDFEGGTVQELRRRMPDVSIFTISMQRTRAEALRDEDRDRADVVIYTAH